MSEKRLSFTAVATAAVHEASTHPSYCFPALLLLAPTLVLQLAAPTYLRTRLAPSLWTVAVGAIVLVWLAQVAVPAACALVHARRAGIRRTRDLPLVGLSLIIGTHVTLGLAAAVVPGLWLQTRYAFAPLLLSDADHTRTSKVLNGSVHATRDAWGRLLLVACVALFVSVLGQSAIAALAEAMNTITATGQENGRTVFQLHLLPHIVTSVAAYLWSAATLTFHAVCVTMLFDEARGVVAPSTQRASWDAAFWRRAGQGAAAVAVLGALIAAVYKIQQHVH